MTAQNARFTLKNHAHMYTSNQRFITINLTLLGKDPEAETPFQSDQLNTVLDTSI